VAADTERLEIIVTAVVERMLNVLDDARCQDAPSRRGHLRLAASKPGSRRFLAISTYMHE
jgi:hypothetical protein